MAAINKGQLFLPAGQEGTEGEPSKVVTVLKANTLPINLATFICASKQITSFPQPGAAGWLVSKDRKKRQEFLVVTLAA